jgi:hypothetical protein
VKGCFVRVPSQGTIMLILPNPLSNPFFSESTSISTRPPVRTPAMLADALARLERKGARRSRVLSGALPRNLPSRWFRPEPRPSVQYAGHMATTAARDHRLTPQAKALLQVLRARCGYGVITESCKTTLAHIMGVCTRSIGRYIAELIRFGYITTRFRRGPRGLYTGLVVTITEKVLPAFRKLPWLAGWLAQNAAKQNLPANGQNPDRTELSHTNHSFKDSYSETWSPPDP